MRIDWFRGITNNTFTAQLWNNTWKNFIDFWNDHDNGTRYWNNVSTHKLTVSGKGVNSYTGTFSLANGGSMPTPGISGILTISENTVGYGAIFYVRGGYNTAYIMSDPVSLSAVTNTSGKFCVVPTGGGAYTMTNNLGSTITFVYSWLGA